MWASWMAYVRLYLPSYNQCFCVCPDSYWASTVPKEFLKEHFYSPLHEMVIICRIIPGVTLIYHSESQQVIHTCQSYKIRNRDPRPPLPQSWGSALPPALSRVQYDPDQGFCISFLKYCLYCTVLALVFSGVV